MSEKKNIVVSVKGRLLNIARAEGKNHQLLLLRYFQERFLYRLYRSRYNKHFCLKGAAFLYALEGERSRGTKDIDFLGINIQATHQSLRKVITNISKQSYENDGVSFNFESLSIEDIVKDGNYHGVRIGITAYLDKTKQRLQLDIGFGKNIKTLPFIVCLFSAWNYYNLSGKLNTDLEFQEVMKVIGSHLKPIYSHLP